ncbi:hypothetical protein K437DRAFT_255697 [Tilletiaria anomala UBC 951]|uniref:Cytochrome c oxidase assembly protein n=1 Tax=Tilletiaria anomala (strain ATCC 24038 / CBS 436.72 / UBC 951) TaxID=1037660 RepID=A0A066WB20_TILAU|nr:uncharacterized protein K437DRAFT_255697 [Tilletiaria anomala UBC 951]KDN47965.1 hypothetical protein K437DRAFT_255697 [Tilletiaria anomala UBC 951]
MSRAAKVTLAASAVLSGLTVWGVHYMQDAERAVMYKGVERDEARQAEKKRQRELDLQLNKEREQEFQKVQPTSGFLAKQQQHGQMQERINGRKEGSDKQEQELGHGQNKQSWWLWR